MPFSPEEKEDPNRATSRIEISLKDKFTKMVYRAHCQDVYELDDEEDHDEVANWSNTVNKLICLENNPIQEFHLDISSLGEIHYDNFEEGEEYIFKLSKTINSYVNSPLQKPLFVVSQKILKFFSMMQQYNKHLWLNWSSGNV